ncbi:hypothetical protein F5Y16DRAFT_157893 [Xylariaceae sp. FL0255]|nr:hypothetical protein F5Y16DRAFT_157893 [Xylariaceae sp. FL0255]
MASPQTGATTLPKGFRFYDDSGPKTPEPFASSDNPQLCPPHRPPRLRLKRRRVSQLHAPTQQFLASIAAADVPIPSVEDAHFEDQEMMDPLPALNIRELDEMEIPRPLTTRMFSPPKTPALELPSCSAPTKYPDWYNESSWSDSDLESSPDYESSRPSTAFSTQTSASLFSLYSQLSEDESCVSPDLKSDGFPNTEASTIPQSSVPQRRHKVAWTRAMSSHLWATYMLYLSDPRVTPIRQGRSAIPPHGVCARVARQAHRTWKGSLPQTSTNSRSGSNTPTAETAKPFMQWSHTPAATRAHLRELCKLKATNKSGRHASQTPIPCSHAAQRRWNRRSTPARSPSVFSARDMVMSLALSTSDTMQPHGPLAQLANTQPEFEVSGALCPEPRTPNEDQIEDLSVGAEGDIRVCEPEIAQPVTEIPEALLREPVRLGSPFTANSYGPSSSSSIVTKLNLPKQPNTVGPRKLLKSPVRLNSSRSGTQKRRSAKGQEEKKAWKRPSLAAAFFREGSYNSETAPKKPSQDVKVEQSNRIEAAAETTTPRELPAFVASMESPQALPSRPPRLGSPFSGSSSSYSFPNRLSSASNFSLAALRRPFATMQSSSQASSDAPSTSRSSLASRLAYLDQRLRDFRNRGGERRRSQSPL